MRRYLLYVLFVVYLCAFLGPFGGNLIISMFPVLEQWFNIDIAIMSLAITFFMIPYGVMQIFGGPLSDIYGRVKVIILGLVVYSLGSFTCALSPTIDILLISRFIQGVGSAILVPATIALLGDVIPSKDLGKAMGGHSVAITTGIAIGPLIGGIIAAIDWRYGFILLGVLSLTLTLLVTKIKEQKKYSDRGFKTAWLGFLKASKDLVILLASIVGFIGFVIRAGIYVYAVDALGKPPYQLSPEYIGFLLSLAGFSGLVASPLAGLLTDKIGRVFTALIGSLFLFLTFIMLALPTWASLMYLIMIFLGLGQTMVFTAIGTIVIEKLPHARGAAAAVHGFFRFTGYALGPVILLPSYTLFGVEGVAYSCLILTTVTLLILFVVKRNLHL